VDSWGTGTHRLLQHDPGRDRIAPRKLEKFIHELMSAPDRYLLC
jgi:hypothetical protein